MAQRGINGLFGADGRHRLSRLPIVVAIAATTLVSGCGDGGGGGGSPPPDPPPTPTPPPPSPPPSVGRLVRPADVNPAATQAPYFNIAINPDPAVAARRRLFVFLPGTDGPPASYERILRTGVARGYHAIGLAYPNDLAVDQACPGVADPECSSKFREEILTGADLSNLVDVDVPNAIVQRLTDLLAYLARTYPHEGWDQFLPGGRIDWSLITVSGHSQGAGHAAYLAKLVALDRVVMFSGVADLGPDGKTARWLSRPNRTPAARQYALGHLRDPVVPFPIQRASWAAIGMDAFGPVTSVDGASPPFGGSHELSTNLEYQPQANPDPSRSIYHSVPVTDGATPLATDGSPVLAATWIYMAFP